MTKFLFSTLLCIFSFSSIHSQYDEKPTLIVALLIDQLRYDYIPKYWYHYSEGGFKKLVSEGYFNANAHYSYMPTFTGVGHATIGTGTTPSLHGIAGNNWYDRKSKSLLYCVDDPEVHTVGSDNEREGKFSPKNLLANTLADQLKILNQKSKAIGISLKDRGAILTIGHLGDAAYWFDAVDGKFITSSYYMDELPPWVVAFNEMDLPRKLMSSPWDTYKPIEEYVHSTDDDMPFEGKLPGYQSSVFPYDLPKLMEEYGVGIIRTTPFGNTYSFEFAKEAVINENLGGGTFTDLLSISLSSPDYLGHMFGPHSKELEDHYIRLDRDIEEFLSFLEEKLGKDNFLLVLSSDHGVADIPAYVKGNTSYMPDRFLKDSLQRYSEQEFGENVIEFVINDQVYLNWELIKNKGLDISNIKQNLVRWFVLQDGIAGASDPSGGLCIADETICASIQRGYNHKRSGDIFFVKSPGWIDQYNLRGGTTHGSPFPYDTHVPIIWYGFKIKPGISHERVSIKDIAPTISSLIGLSFPNAATGVPITGILNAAFHMGKK